MTKLLFATGFFGILFLGLILLAIFGSTHKHCPMSENAVLVEKVKNGRIVGHTLLVRCYPVARVWYRKNQITDYPVTDRRAAYAALLRKAKMKNPHLAV
ncbi:MAG: hypothetical protein GY774_33715 [Planctomycetes bacterium]|nr:hypothetical protein [Planctomycetota bacterium]|tara:strand:- start:1000 stop:1296 length:297 start_codon:yes stop_codon:yes gene_type:complete